LQLIYRQARGTQVQEGSWGASRALLIVGPVTPIDCVLRKAVPGAKASPRHARLLTHDPGLASPPRCWCTLQHAGNVGSVVPADAVVEFFGPYEALAIVAPEPAQPPAPDNNAVPGARVQRVRLRTF
jgi:hypothetical protein